MKKFLQKFSWQYKTIGAIVIAILIVAGLQFIPGWWEQTWKNITMNLSFDLGLVTAIVGWIVSLVKSNKEVSNLYSKVKFNIRKDERYGGYGDRYIISNESDIHIKNLSISIQDDGIFSEQVRRYPWLSGDCEVAIDNSVRIVGLGEIKAHEDKVFKIWEPKGFFDDALRQVDVIYTTEKEKDDVVHTIRMSLI